MTPEQENLAIFYRTMSTAQLLTYRAALEDDTRTAQRSRGKRGTVTVAFCASRIDVITHVLGERGVGSLT